MVKLLALACAFVAQADSDKSVYNTRSLVDREWRVDGMTTYQVPTNVGRGRNRREVHRPVNVPQWRVLSLIPDERWDKGVAWILDVAEQRPERPLRAYKGRYMIYGNKLAEDLLLVEVLPTRVFAGVRGKDGDAYWILQRLATDDAPCEGVQFELQLDERHVPSDSLVLSPAQFCFVGDDGSETTRYTVEEALGGLIRYRGKAYTPQGTGFLHGREILELEPISEIAVADAAIAPPGFRWRAKSAGRSSSTNRYDAWRREVFALGVLTDREWLLVDDRIRLLSLRPGKSHASGVVWLVESSRNEEASLAWKGRYEISTGGYREGILAFELTIEQKFTGRSDGARMLWTVEREPSGYGDIGTTIELELCVSDEGAEQRSLESLWLFPRRRQAAEDKNRPNVTYAHGGVSGVLLSNTSMEKYARRLPPGFKLRRPDGLPSAVVSAPAAAAPTAAELIKIGRNRFEAGESEAALRAFRQAHELEPTIGTRKWCARVLVELHRINEWVAEMEAMLRDAPKDDDVANMFAWYLATAPEERYRDGKRAVDMMLPVCRRTDWSNADYIDTLAAAYAAAGDFKWAAFYADQALRKCKDDKKADLQSRLKLFESGKPLLLAHFARSK